MRELTSTTDAPPPPRPPPPDKGPAPDVSPELAAALPQESDSVEVPAAPSDAATGADTPPEGRPDIASAYLADYVPSADPQPSVEGPHESPEGWAADVNPDRDAPGRDNNCGECARAVECTWEGDPAAAAALSDPDSGGEPVARMAEWAGQAPTEASLSDVQQRLDELGPGSSAVVGCDWQTGGGHWFNAVNDGGTVKAVDGQSGQTETWPPSRDGLGYSEADMSYSDAIFFTADGKVDR